MSERDSLREFRISTWPEGFTVEAKDEEQALVVAVGRITEDAYLLAAEEVGDA